MQNQEECSLEERLVDIYFYIPENKSVDSSVSTQLKAHNLHTLYLLTFYTAATGATISERKQVSHSS